MLVALEFTALIFVILEATELTFAISVPTKFTLAILFETTSISDTASCKSLATSITLLISEPTLLTFAILVATTLILAWFVARELNPDIPASVLIFDLSLGVKKVFSK